MKKTLLSLTIVFAMISCSQPDEAVEIQQEQNLLTQKEINAKITTSLEQTGDFDWMSQDAHTIWSAVSLGDNILTIGYGSDENNYAKSEETNSIKNELIALVKSFEPTSSKGSIELYEDENINVIDVKVTQKETIQVLLNDSRVRYIEPAGYQFLTSEAQAKSDSSSSSGCGYEATTLNSNDYRTITPGARVPWSFDAHNIPQAWNYSTGAGVTVAVIDTGLSPQQRWMNQYFNDGYSSGRTVQKYGTFVDSWWSWSNNYDGVNDKCGHGTSMASAATAPRNNNNLPVGVAYNANLVSYRAVENVVIDDYHEKRGVAEALTALGNRSDVRVISMSIGSPFSIGRVEDAVKYAYNRGKMIIAAGGTSTSFTTWYGVIFPANMSETVAATGVREGQYSKCDVCHTGSKIDFTIQMQRTNGTSNKVPVLSYYDGKSDYVGGSSVATATTAGIAALVWAKHPSWSRAQVLQKMKESSDFYPNKHSQFGYGNIDALKAVQ
ncbi:S8 family serine peptidase [Tenacibaculum tangerinum]|uniref:S8 family serine peptidase n=1 Tax=Tenacibaculum tangerinum TaxID=3038772 RepID=A0ABY8L1S3_9FLAO|nr:S8 family serine peptidase [Tenacibaculum tangerinum]WGH75401.1 S8 family serine peptidase [Tenacibaculum tangerinum]